MKKFLLIFVLVLVAAVAAFAGDISTVMGVKELIHISTVTSTVTGTAVDVGNFGGVAIVVNTSSGTLTANTNILLQLTECASSTGTFTAVTAAEMIGVTPDASGTIASILATQASPLHVKLGYVGGYQYLKLKSLASGSISFSVCANAIGMNPHVAPIASGD